MRTGRQFARVHQLVPSKIDTQHNSEHIMPKYSIYTLEGLDDFYPTQKKLFIEDEKLNICNLNHYEENCHMDTRLALSSRHPHLHLIYLNPSLEPIIRNIVKNLKMASSFRRTRGSPQFSKLHLNVSRLWEHFTDQPNINCRSS